MVLHSDFVVSWRWFTGDLRWCCGELMVIYWWFVAIHCDLRRFTGDLWRFMFMLWWLNGDLLVMCGDSWWCCAELMVIYWWFVVIHSDFWWFMVMLWWLMVVNWWFVVIHGDLLVVHWRLNGDLRSKWRCFMGYNSQVRILVCLKCGNPHVAIVMGDYPLVI